MSSLTLISAFSKDNALFKGKFRIVIDCDVDYYLNNSDVKCMANAPDLNNLPLGITKNDLNQISCSYNLPTKAIKPNDSNSWVDVSCSANAKNPGLRGTMHLRLRPQQIKDLQLSGSVTQR